MEKINRKIEYKLYPSKKQQIKLEEILEIHRKLYNNALQHRIEGYKYLKNLDLDKKVDKTKINELTINFSKQCKELTEIRNEFKEFEQINAQSQQKTLKRLDEAFKHFFRRVRENKKKPEKSKQKVGYPRFKSCNRFKSFGYKSHGDGWKFEVGKKEKNGTLRVSNVGTIQARGRGRFIDKEKTSRNHGKPKTLEVLKRGQNWYASVTFEMKVLPYRESGEQQIGMDWGLEQFLTIINSDKEVQTYSNPRFLRKELKTLKKAQRKLSCKKLRSKGFEKQKHKVASIHREIANKRKNELDQVSKELVQNTKFIGTEKLNIKGMTKKGGAYKKGLNRSILDSSPGLFLQLVEYKAEEAGIPFIPIDTKEVKPSQRCFNCDNVEKKELSDRTHNCKKCNFQIHRDINAALVILREALLLFAGQELSLGVEETVAIPTKSETPPRAQA